MAPAELLTATALSAIRTSAFEEGTVELLDAGPQELAPGAQLSFPSPMVSVNLDESAGSEFRFDLDATGEGTQSGQGCSDSSSLIVRIG